jgi:hypothetical protein
LPPLWLLKAVLGRLHVGLSPMLCQSLLNPIAEGAFGYTCEAVGCHDIAFEVVKDAKDEGFVVGGVTFGHGGATLHTSKER